MDKIKENKPIIFVKKYKIALILGALVACYVTFFPSDYTEDVIKLEKEISIYKSKIKSEENKHLKTINEKIDEQIGSINAEIENLKPEVDKLQNIKTDLQAKYDEKLRIEAEKEKQQREQTEKENTARRENQYYEDFLSYSSSIGKSVIEISNAYNSSDFETHARAINELIAKCKNLKSISSPSRDYDDVHRVIVDGCDKYIESAGNMAKGVLKFDTSYFDQALQQSREAGKYFENAIYMFGNLRS